MTSTAGGESTLRRPLGRVKGGDRRPVPGGTRLVRMVSWEVTVGDGCRAPLTPAREEKPTMSSGQPATGAAPAAPVVLLVEDNADAREALRALLELDGYGVE